MLNIFREVKSSDPLLFQNNKIILCSSQDAPEFLKDNEFIEQGYLLNCNTINKVSRSLFICHNETINIWSHLLGALGVIALVFYTGICIHENSMVINRVIDFNKMLNEIKYVTDPWISSLNNYENDYTTNLNEDISNQIDNNNLIAMTHDWIKNITNSSSISDTITAFISSSKRVIERMKNSMGFDLVLNAFNILQSNLMSIADKALVILKDEGSLKDSSNAEDAPLIIHGLTRAPIFVMLTSALICLGFSAFFHLFKALSKEASSFLSRLDYAGISILISGSCYPPFFYFFYCKPGI